MKKNIFYIILCIGVLSCQGPMQKIGTNEILGKDSIDIFTHYSYGLLISEFRSPELETSIGTPHSDESQYPAGIMTFQYKGDTLPILGRKSNVFYLDKTFKLHELSNIHFGITEYENLTKEIERNKSWPENKKILQATFGKRIMQAIDSLRNKG